jgi:hypothetical protein
MGYYEIVKGTPGGTVKKPKPKPKPRKSKSNEKSRLL